MTDPNPELTRATRVLTAMERVLAGVQPTDPPDMVAYWRRCRDRAVRDVARAETVSVAEALGDGWFREGVS